jgi:hypothetical protein
MYPRHQLDPDQAGYDKTDGSDQSPGHFVPCATVIAGIEAVT